MRSKSEAIAGIALIMLASIMAGTTAVGATSEGPLSANDCPIGLDSGMELYSSLCARALVCGYRNSVDINNCGDIAIWPYDNARDAQKRFKDMRTSKEEWGDILRVDDDEIVVINRDSNYHYSVSGCFLRVCSEKSYITEVRVNTAIKDKNTTIKWFEELAGCAKSIIDKKCGEKKEEIDLVIQEKHERWIDKAKGTYNVSYTIKNIGDGTVSAGHSTSLFVDGVLKETQIVPVDLKANGVYTDMFYTLLTVSGENDTIKVYGDYNNDAKESDETNNFKENVWEALPDLVVLEIKRKQVDKVFGKYKIEYDIKNIGKGTASAGHNTSLFVDDMLNETKVVPVDLKHNGIYTDTFDTNIKRSGESDTIKVCADHNNDVAESKETINCKEKVWEALLKVIITAPVKNFEVRKGEKVDIVANVKDDLNNMVKRSNTNSVVASFTTEKKKIDLHDDGKHNDGGNDDGVYANTWTPTKTGDCTITVTAMKTDFKDGVDKVNGIVIAKPVLEIPARFKNVHPYKNRSGKDAPVFQRTLEEPIFEVTNLTELPGGTELIVVIEEPQGRNKYKLINNLTVSKKSSGTKQCAEWDWSSNGHSRAADVIPIGVYRALAKLINSTDKSTLIASEPKNFYVIFNWEGQGKDAFVTNENGYQFYAFPSSFLWGYGEEEYRLHQHHPKIWKKPLDDLSTKQYSSLYFGGRSYVDLTDIESVAKCLAGLGYVTAMIKKPAKTNDCWPGKNNLWYDNLKAVEARTGTCTDQSAYAVGVLRSIGIPARMVGCKGTKGVPSSANFGKDELPHAFVEAWYSNDWHFSDPANLENSNRFVGKIGSSFYTDEGVQFRPDGVGLHNKKYWVTTSNTAPGKDTINIYKWYNYNMDIVDLRFDKISYKPGATMKITIDVKNTGYLTIPNPRLEVKCFSEAHFTAPVPRGAQIIPFLSNWVVDVDVAGSLAPNQQVTKTVSSTAPRGLYSPYCSYSYFIIAKPYTQWNTDKAYTFTYIRRIPGYSIIPIYSIDVDGVKKTLQRFNSSFFESNVTDEKAYIKDSYEWGDMPANVELYSEINLGRNYSETIVTIENPDSEYHVYNFSMPLYGFGNAAHVPAIGTITSNTTLNVEASHIITYNQSSDEDINVSVYEFSKDAKIKAIEILEHKGIKLVKADACWNITLSPGSSHKICVYSSTRQGQPDIAGFDFSEIYTTLANEIVDNGDSLMNLKVSAPEEVRVAETIPINVTVFNNGIVEETLNLFVNVSRTPRYSRTPNLIYTDTTSISVSPNTEKTLTYPVYISKDTAATVWDVSVDTDKVITATAAFTVNDAFDLDCVQDLEVVHNEVFPFNTTIINTWDTTVHDVKATIHLFGSFTTLDPEELHIGDLLPNERKTISWRLSTTYGGELPLDVSVTSDDGGYDMISSTITSLSPPDLWIPNIITHTDAPDFGTSKTVCMNVTLQNLGDLTANSVQVQLLLPENVTSTALTHDIGDLLGGEQKSVSIDITFSTQNDFAFDVVAKDDANHSAIGTMMMSFSAMDLADLTLTSDNIRVRSNENTCVFG